LRNAGRQLAIAAALMAIVPLTGGCSAGEHARALAGSPPALAALHEQANELLPGGVDAYRRRIEALDGYPVVVNIWASWCGPCRLEFPALQSLSARHGKQVAFIGVNKENSVAAARTFLREAPVPYPSYSDPDSAIAEEIGAPRGLPHTAYYDRRGGLCFLKQGPYLEHGELAADVRRFAVREECESG
jgi:cytochrome c biogenesis protein CcmG/thiol:disulfide interchange protein DsbE